MRRCDWCLKDDLYIQYHDEEWGEVCKDDEKLFECLILEAFQAGLSWYTILKKREGFRQAFKGFNPELISKFSEEDIQALLQNADIIRHRGKIEATIAGAKAFLEIKKEQSFSDFIWNGKDIHVNKLPDLKQTISKNQESDILSKRLKAVGFKFVGSTTCYSFMQAIGMVNDHLDYCFKK